MKVYISGSYACQARLREQAAKLFHMGHQVTGTWLNEVTKPEHLTEDEWHRGLAIKDLAEVAAADCIILDLDGESTSGGRAVEWGFALGRFNMLKLVVGESTWGVFFQLADAKFDNWDDVINYITLNYPILGHQAAPAAVQPALEYPRISVGPLPGSTILSGI